MHRPKTVGKTMKQDHIDYMQVKAASEVMEEVRKQALLMICHYKVWRKRHAGDLLKSSHLLMHDDLMLAQIRDMIQLYRTTNREYHNLYRRFMADIQRGQLHGEQRRKEGAA
jgi:hypothetical protein